MESAQVIDHIKQTAASVLPKGSTLYLYGSRAREDAHEGSDWDLLLLLDKPDMDWRERERMEFPFVEVGWDLGEDISTRAYTKSQWHNGPHSMFYFNVEEDKKVIYES